MTFKRNQVEEALRGALQQAGTEDATNLRIRLKRLLDTDRTLSRKVAGGHSLAYAFYTGEPPGGGVEVWFLSYEAFALLLGVLLLKHRWSQSTAVRILRQARPMLEPEHGRILSLDPGNLFDPEKLSEQAKPGRPATQSADPVFLAMISGGRTAQRAPHALPLDVRVCRGEPELMRFFHQRASAGASMTVLELTAPAHLLVRHLSHTKPKARGRASR